MLGSSVPGMDDVVKPDRRDQSPNASSRGAEANSYLTKIAYAKIFLITFIGSTPVSLWSRPW